MAGIGKLGLDPVDEGFGLLNGKDRGQGGDKARVDHSDFDTGFFGRDRVASHGFRGKWAKYD